MKIQKALEKVREQRARIAADGKGAAGRGPLVDRREWVAPVYSQSRCLVPDDGAALKNRCVCLLSNAPALDYYKVLRTQLVQRMQAKGWNTIMITSIRPGEGKTLTSINLALTFAKGYDQTALLVDCDLRQQSVYRRLGLASDKGIADYLLGGQPLSDLIIWPKIEKFTLISGGPTIAQSAELLGSPRMKELMAEMKHRYADRYVIVDSPPILSGADTLTLTPLVDGIVIVVESGNTAIKEIQEALALIPQDKFLGFVLNKHTSPRDGYYQYYERRSDKM